MVQPKLFHEAGPEVLDQYVALSGKLGGGSAPFLRRDVEDDAFLVAVERAKEPDAKPWQIAGLVAAGRLDLDDLGPQIGQDHAACRPHDHVRELDHADAGQRKIVFLIHGSAHV